jgi:hypothetical protein
MAHFSKLALSLIILKVLLPFKLQLRRSVQIPSSIYAADLSKVVPLCVPQMFVYVVLYCFGDTFAFVSLVVFSSTVCIFPIATSFYLFFHLPSPGLMSPSPVPLWA